MHLKSPVIAIPFAILGICDLHAGTAEIPATVDEPATKVGSTYDKIWDMFSLYKNEENPLFQELALTGRYNGQYYLMDSAQGDDDDWENRRFRVGLKATVLRDFEIKTEIFGDLNEGGDFYEGLTESYIEWKPDTAFNLTVGKQKPRFSLDWSTSSREILTFERNILINNFGIDYATGVSVAGQVANWSYYAGVLNNDVGDPGGKSEYGDFSGAYSYIANVGYDFKNEIHVDKAVLRLDYLHSGHDANDDLLTKFDDSFATSISLKQGAIGLNAEAVYATGDVGDAWAFYLTPNYDITKKLQVVGRYTFGRSGDDILTAQKRYERTAPGLTDGGNGETYNAGYLGLNYRVYGDRLKLMGGLEYAHMDGGGDGGDFDGWTWLTGIRMYW